MALLLSETSTTLLRDVSNPQHARWSEFYARYEPMMRAYLRERFPTLEADDIIQNTFVSLSNVLSRSGYSREDGKHFHNFLTGVLRNKALDALRAIGRTNRISKRLERAVPDTGTSANEREYADWQRSVFEIALRQFLSDETVCERDKQVFVRTAIDGDAPEAVSESLGVSVDQVYLIRHRCKRKMQRWVDELKNT